MRVAPVGLAPGLSDEQRAGAAQLQSVLTHGHPTALAASDLTAHAVRLLAHGVETGGPVRMPATGLLCFLLFPEEPVTALRRAACTSGDSDSIACLTGAFAGAFSVRAPGRPGGRSGSSTGANYWSWARSGTLRP